MAEEDADLAGFVTSFRREGLWLLWAALADTDPGAAVTVGHVTAANQWAIDVARAARLDLHQEGYLGVRGMPPTPYVHNGALL